MTKSPDTAMSAAELDLVARVAGLYGISTEEAHTQLAKAGLARRVRRRTGKGPARVLELKRGKESSVGTPRR